MRRVYRERCDAGRALITLYSSILATALARLLIFHPNENRMRHCVIFDTLTDSRLPPGYADRESESKDLQSMTCRLHRMVIAYLRQAAMY